MKVVTYTFNGCVDITGKIIHVDDGPLRGGLLLCQNHISGNNYPNNTGYKYAWWISFNDIKYIQIIDREEKLKRILKCNK